MIRSFCSVIFFLILGVSLADKRTIPTGGSHPSIAAIVRLQGSYRSVIGTAVIVNNQWLLTSAHLKLKLEEKVRILFLVHFELLFFFFN